MYQLVSRYENLDPPTPVLKRPYFREGFSNWNSFKGEIIFFLIDFSKNFDTNSLKCQTQGAFVCVKDVKVSTCPWQGVFNLPGLSLLTLGQKFYFELKILETDAKNIIK